MVAALEQWAGANIEAEPGPLTLAGTGARSQTHYHYNRSDEDTAAAAVSIPAVYTPVAKHSKVTVKSWFENVRCNAPLLTEMSWFENDQREHCRIYPRRPYPAAPQGTAHGTFVGHHDGLPSP